MTTTLKCQECQELFKYESPSRMAHKKYCDDCLLKHKEECMSHYKHKEGALGRLKKAYENGVNEANIENQINEISLKPEKSMPNFSFLDNFLPKNHYNLQRRKAKEQQTR